MNRTRNKKQAGWIVGAFASASLALGCGGPQGADRVGPLEAPSADNEGIAELTQPLAAPTAGSCRFYATADSGAGAIKGQLDVAIDSGETFVLSKHALNGNVLINGFEKTCYAGASPSTTLTTVKGSDVKFMKITGAAGTETIVLDFANGTFGAAVAGTAGTGVSMAAAIENVKIRTGSAADKIYFLVDGTGARFADFDGKAPADISLLNASAAYTVNLGSGLDILDASGNVALFGTGTVVFDKALTVYGANDVDTITGGSAGDTIYGGSGADVIKGGAGADAIRGGPGGDTLYGDTGNDVVQGEEGSDTINEGTASNGSDRLYGWLDPNDADGSGTASATEQLGAVSSSGVAIGSEPTGDVDTITYAGRTNPVVLSPGTSSAGGVTSFPGTTVWTVVNTNTAAEVLADYNDGEASEADMIRGDFDIVIGGSGNDTLYSGPNDETLNGGDGDDTLFALRTGATDGADVFVGGAGTDTVSYRSRAATVCVSIAASTSTSADKNDGTGTCTATPGVVSGVLTVTYAVSATTEDGGGNPGDDVQSDVEVVEGGAGADILVGNASNNVLRGAAGADTLVGEGGDDIFDEAFGLGANFNTANTANDGDTFYGGSGKDTVDYSSKCTGCYQTSRATSICATIPLSTDDTGTANSGAGGTITNGTSGSSSAVACTATENDLIKRDIEGLTGGTVADFLVGNDLDNVLDGFSASSGTDVVKCGLGEGDMVFKATDLGYDGIFQAAGSTDPNACEL